MNDKQTLDYYDAHAEAYFKQTYSVGFSDIYEKFINELPNIPQQTIPDVGCGSGRDSIHFAQKGFKVTAIDGSPALLGLAKESTDHAIEWKQILFEDISKQNWKNQFSGIWACASLLHVPFAELSSIVTALSYCLKPEGVMYLSFKYGNSERVDGDRFFCDLNERRIDKLLNEVSKQNLISILLYQKSV